MLISRMGARLVLAALGTFALAGGPAGAANLAPEGISAGEVEAVLKAGNLNPHDFSEGERGFLFEAQSGDTEFIVYTDLCTERPAADGEVNEWSWDAGKPIRQCGFLVFLAEWVANNVDEAAKLANDFNQQNYLGRSYIHRRQGQPERLVLEYAVYVGSGVSETFIAAVFSQWTDLILPNFTDGMSAKTSDIERLGTARRVLAATEVAPRVNVRVNADGPSNPGRSWDWVNTPGAGAGIEGARP